MYCPRCGQQTVTGDVRFCSKCGMQLKLIADITANAGLPLPVGSQNALAPGDASDRTVRLAAKMIFAAIGLSPLFFGFCFIVDGPAPLLVPGTVFVVGLCLLLYTLFSRKLDETLNPAGPRVQPNQLINGPAGSVSTAPPRSPIHAFTFRSPTTSDLAQPSTVTDRTTQLFEE